MHFEPILYDNGLGRIAGWVATYMKLLTQPNGKFNSSTKGFDRAADDETAPENNGK